MSNSGSSSSGISGSSLLQVAFIVLKLTHVIDWSWWWVLSPMWISLIIVAFFIAVYVFIKDK